MKRREYLGDDIYNDKNVSRKFQDSVFTNIFP